MDIDSKVSILAGIEAMKEEMAAVIAAQRQVGRMQSERDKVSNELKEVIAEHRDRMPNTTRILGTRNGETLVMSAIRVVRERDSAQQELAALRSVTSMLVADGRRWLPKTDEALQTKRGESTVAAAKRVVKERDEAVADFKRVTKERDDANEEISALIADRAIAQSEGGALPGESLCDMVRRLVRERNDKQSSVNDLLALISSAMNEGGATLDEGLLGMVARLRRLPSNGPARFTQSPLYGACMKALGGHAEGIVDGIERIKRERDDYIAQLDAANAKIDKLIESRASTRRWLNAGAGQRTVAAAEALVNELHSVRQHRDRLMRSQHDLPILVASILGAAGIEPWQKVDDLVGVVGGLRRDSEKLRQLGAIIQPKGDASIVEGARVLLQQLKDAQEEVAVLRGSRGNENRSLRAAYEAQRNARGKVQSVLDEVKTALDIKGGLNSDVLPRAKNVMKDRQQLQAKIDLIDGVLHPLPLGSKYWRFDASASPDASRTVDVKPMADKLKDEIDRSIFDSIKGHGADAMRYALNGASTNTDGVEDKTKVDSSTPRNGKFSAIAGVSIFNHPYLNDKWLLMMPKRGFDLFGSNKF